MTHQTDLEAFPLTAEEITAAREQLRRLQANSGYLTGIEHTQLRLLATLDRECSARQSLIAELRAGVEGLPRRGVPEYGQDGQRYENLDRAAVLALLDEAVGETK